MVIVGLLTLLTQIGGIVYLLAMLIYKVMDRFVQARWRALLWGVLSFVALYSLATFRIVPAMALKFGRVPLPVFEQRNFQPTNVLTCVLNRHYVQSPLREAAYGVADVIAVKYPGAMVNYLDANFPFIDGFPLIPHLSHNDGKKLDMSFQYKDKAGTLTNAVPSWIGYGICEEPAAGEADQAALCDAKGHWQYSLLKKVIPQGAKEDFVFDAQRTADLVNAFVERDKIGKIFIEPHLVARLNLTSEKIRFHGCQAVRHDDHIHVQLK